MQIHNIDINVNFFVEDATTGEQKPKRVSNRVGGLIGQVFSTVGNIQNSPARAVAVLHVTYERAHPFVAAYGVQIVAFIVLIVDNLL